MKTDFYIYSALIIPLKCQIFVATHSHRFKSNPDNWIEGQNTFLSVFFGPEKNEIVYFFSQCFRFVFKVYGHPADDDVRGDTSGSFQTLCLVQLGNSVDDGVQTGDRTVEEDARRLWRVNIQLRIMYIPW